ncbi:MAG TPA: super-infection exclusion protein B [Opitutaceae bacterium]|nr:super-infection exclusion protein B [Opitutaceae bacterium]
MSSWPDWLKITQLRARFLFVIWFVSGFVLFAPDRWLFAFGLLDFRRAQLHWIGIVTLTTFVLWVVQVFEFFVRKAKTNNFKKNALAALNALSHPEFIIIAYCLRNRQQTITLEVTHQYAHALAQKGLLVAASGAGNSLAWPFTIPPFVWDHLLETEEQLYQWHKVDPDSHLFIAELQSLNRHIHRHDRPW